MRLPELVGWEGWIATAVFDGLLLGVSEENIGAVRDARIEKSVHTGLDDVVVANESGDTT